MNNLEKFKAFVSGFSNWLCTHTGHDWRYNFPIQSHPSKRICARCRGKQRFSGNIYQYWIDGFEDKRADEDIIKIWFKS